MATPVARSNTCSLTTGHTRPGPPRPCAAPRTQLQRIDRRRSSSTLARVTPAGGATPEAEGPQQPPKTASSSPQPQPKGKDGAAETPTRRTNRDILLGVITVRAVRTLVVYLHETNVHLAGWLVQYMNKNPINLASPDSEESSGASFIKKMLTLPIQQAKYENGIDPMHATTNGCHVDPRSIAQRILAIRAQIAGEMRDDMKCVLEDNTDLVRRFARSSLENCLKISAAPEAMPPLAGAVAAENN